jgi:hypothetical protein
LEKRVEELHRMGSPDAQSYSATEDKFREDFKDIAVEIFTIVERIRDELRASTEPAIPMAGPVPMAVLAPAPAPAAEPTGPLDRASYAAKVMDTVANALPDDWRLEREVRQVPGTDYSFDGLIKSETKTIAVETFHNPDLGSAAAERDSR